MTDDQPVEYCVFCGRPIPPSDTSLSGVKHLYCSTTCAHRQQLALKRLRDTTPTSEQPTP